ncbi:DUF3794 and LysM peptidoglycan-binding domain-containing protein [Dethiothermospora halolimnae]|uniref:DUF3794 and LysM peptidoglycan-binding domain-containing protein n=1 Tax=Dethiothermospora halolimnae TaxID=3114390 RepID=UPI003CCBDD43
MSVELIKDLIKIDQTIAKEEIQSLVEGEIYLPDNKPNINKILTIDGDAEVTSVKAQKDKIIVGGIVKFKALYNADDENQPIHSIEASTDFRDEIEIKGATEEVLVDIKSLIEHIDYNQLDEKRISVKTVLSLEGKVKSNDNIDIVKEVVGEEGLQVLKETIKYNEVIGTNASSTMVKEAFEVSKDMPNILDILRTDTKVYEKETKVVDDKAVVNGIIDLSIMYFGDDAQSQINYLNHEIPFTHFVEIAGALKDMKSNVKFGIEEMVCDTKEDIEGNIRVFDIETIVKVEADVYEEREKEITADTYSTNKKFNVQKKALDISENVGHYDAKEIVKGTISCNDSIKDVYNINMRPNVTDYRVVEGKVIIESFLTVDMLYEESNSNNIKVLKEEIPFKTYIDIEDIKDGIEVEVEGILEGFKYDKTSSSEVEIEATVKNSIDINRIKTINMVVEAEELEEEVDKKSRPSITVYIVQKEDTIWDIAKRYNTTVEELIETNEILAPENIMPGEKIIIEKNLELNL